MVDLHLHSTFSDGVHTPARLIELAAAAGLEAVAIADHDNIDGTEEAMTAGRMRQVDVLPAVELSVIWEDYEDIHLLGYCFDHRAPALREALREFQDYRESRNERIVQRINERLRQEGRELLDFEEIRRRAEGTLGRPHIGMALIAKGHVGNMEEAFQRYLVPCNMPKRFFPIQEAIDLIHQAGGMTSLAHPPYITNDRKKLQKLFDRFAALGLDGIEAYNNRSTNDDIDWYISQARRRDLAVTGGSDFHGTEGGELVIGGIRGNLRIPYWCVEEIRRKAAQFS
ncbi:MAG: PHP domain-containing protein [Syntrophotaleaceae bacterium]